MEQPMTTGETVLVVDDDRMVRQSIDTLLAFYGFTVWQAEDAATALALLEERQPDLLLTDIRMPGMSGAELLLALRERGREFPVIVMTGYADMDSAIAAVKGGAFDFVRKPWDPEQLVQSIRRATKHYRLLALEKEYTARLEQEVQAKTAEIERSSRLKTEFLNNISHEIRTPVNGIVGMISLIREADSLETVAGYLGLMESSALQLVRVVDDLVTLAGVMTGAMAPVMAPTDLRPLIASALQRVRELHGTAATRITWSVTPELPRNLVLEAKLLEMALFQLVENGVKFAAPGGVAVVAGYDPLQGELRLTVTDEGPGMDERLQLQVMEPFVQGDGSNTRRHGGLGIGLNIVQKVADYLQGRFAMNRAATGGVEAVLCIPTVVAP